MIKLRAMHTHSNISPHLRTGYRTCCKTDCSSRQSSSSDICLTYFYKTKLKKKKKKQQPQQQPWKLIGQILNPSISNNLGTKQHTLTSRRSLGCKSPLRKNMYRRINMIYYWLVLHKMAIPIKGRDHQRIKD